MKNLKELNSKELIVFNGGEEGDAAYLIGAASAVTTLIVLAPAVSTYLLLKELF